MGSRDRLKAMSLRNTQERDKTVDTPTLVSHIVNELDGTTEAVKPVEEVIPAPVMPEPFKEEKIETVENAKATKNATNAKTTVIPDKKKSPGKQAKVDADRYSGKEITVSILIQEEVYDFLYCHSMDLGLPMKAYFKQLMIEEMDPNVTQDEELIKQYRKTQHDTIKKSVLMDVQLKEDIQKKAAENHVRPTAFMSYVIHKAKKRYEN